MEPCRYTVLAYTPSDVALVTVAFPKMSTNGFIYEKIVKTA